MINKTFNSDSTDGRALEVGRNGERPWLNIHEFDFENTMFMLAPSDAPALALAILEAAIPDGQKVVSAVMADALQALRDEVKRIEDRDSAARELAELEAEAVELYRTSFKARMGRESRVKGLDDMVPNSREEWLDVARRAREMRNEKKVNTDD